MRAASTIAELMGKYAKSALVLLYALQIATLCREQIVHLYHVAVSAAHGDHRAAAPSPDDGHGETTSILGSVVEKAKRFFGESGHHRIAAAPGIPMTMLLAVDDHGHEKHHHPHEEKNRERRRRDDANLRFIADLSERLRRIALPEGAADEHRPSDIIRFMRFAAT